MRNLSSLRTGADPSRNAARMIMGYKLVNRPQQTAAIGINVFSLRRYPRERITL